MAGIQIIHVSYHHLNLDGNKTVAFWIPEFCVVSCCALPCQFQCSPMSSSANGPLARAAKRHRGVNPMMAPMNPFLASMFGPAFALLVPTRADRDRWGALLNVTNNDMGSWCAFFVSCCQTSGTAWPVLSKQNQLIGFSLNRLNRIK